MQTMTGVAGASYFRRMEQRVIVSKLENVGQGRERRESSHGRHEPYDGTRKKQRVALQLTSQKSALNWTRTPRNRLRRTRPDFFENQALRSSLPPPNSKPTFLQPGIRLYRNRAPEILAPGEASQRRRYVLCQVRKGNTTERTHGTMRGTREVLNTGVS